MIAKLAKLEKALKAQANTYRTVQLYARLLEARGEGEQALKLIRAHVKREGARPEEALVLVQYLTRQKRVAEALAECEAARTTCPPESVSAAAVVVLRGGGAGDKDCQRVEGWIRAALKSNPESVVLRMRESGEAMPWAHGGAAPNPPAA